MNSSIRSSTKFVVSLRVCVIFPAHPLFSAYLFYVFVSLLIYLTAYVCFVCLSKRLSLLCWFAYACLFIYLSVCIYLPSLYVTLPVCLSVSKLSVLPVYLFTFLFVFILRCKYVLVFVTMFICHIFYFLFVYLLRYYLLMSLLISFLHSPKLPSHSYLSHTLFFPSEHCHIIKSERIELNHRKRTNISCMFRLGIQGSGTHVLP